MVATIAAAYDAEPSPARRLTLLYLANDVVQNARKKVKRRGGGIVLCLVSID